MGGGQLGNRLARAQVGLDEEPALTFGFAEGNTTLTLGKNFSPKSLKCHTKVCRHDDIFARLAPI